MPSEEEEKAKIEKELISQNKTTTARKMVAEFFPVMYVYNRWWFLFFLFHLGRKYDEERTIPDDFDD